MTPPPVSADVGRQRGGRKDRGGRFRACACRGHRGKRDAVGEESWVVSCCCGVCKCPITKGSFWCENEHPNGDHSCYLTGCAEISHRRNKHVRVESANRRHRARRVSCTTAEGASGAQREGRRARTELKESWAWEGRGAHVAVRSPSIHKINMSEARSSFLFKQGDGGFHYEKN